MRFLGSLPAASQPQNRPQLIRNKIDISESSTSDCSHHRHTSALAWPSRRSSACPITTKLRSARSLVPGRAAAFMIDGSAADPRRRPAPCSGRHTVTVHSRLRIPRRVCPSGPLVVPLKRPIPVSSLQFECQRDAVLCRRSSQKAVSTSQKAPNGDISPTVGEVPSALPDSPTCTGAGMEAAGGVLPIGPMEPMERRLSSVGSAKV